MKAHLIGLVNQGLIYVPKVGKWCFRFGLKCFSNQTSKHLSAKEIHKIRKEWMNSVLHDSFFPLAHGQNSVENATRAENRVRGLAWGGATDAQMSTYPYQGHAGCARVKSCRFSYQITACHTFSNLNNPLIITNPMYRWGNGGSERLCNLSKLTRLVRVTKNMKIKFWYWRLCLLS